MSEWVILDFRPIAASLAGARKDKAFLDILNTRRKKKDLEELRFWMHAV
jgi:hypothetical protein